jgi:hypothetical protein
MFPVVMEAVRVLRLGGGRARTRPGAVMGDKAYSSRANRALLRGRGIKAFIPKPSDQNRTAQTPRFTRRGPVNFDAETYKGRNTVERSFGPCRSSAADHRGCLSCRAPAPPHSEPPPTSRTWRGRRLHVSHEAAAPDSG